MRKCLKNEICYNRIPQTGWLKQQQFISHSSGGWKSKIRVPAGWLLVRGLWCKSFLFPHMAGWDSRRGEERKRQTDTEIETVYFDLFIPLQEYQSYHGVSTLMIYVTIIISQRPYIQIPSHWKLVLPHMNLGKNKCWGQNIQYIPDCSKYWWRYGKTGILIHCW